MSDILKIMVVDDEPGMLRGIERALRGFTVQVPDINGQVRFEVESAASGEQALAQIAVAAPHILLLDYKLPGMSGLDLLEKVAPDHADMLTIMITAYASLETAVAATKKGAYDFLAKPFTPEELKGAIRKAAGRLILSRQAHKLAQEKRQVRFQFISVLAHELKAPLGAVEGYLHIIRDRSAGDDPKTYDHMLDRSLIRMEGMRKMILDLLDLTRIESGVRRRELVEVDVGEVARHAVETALPSAQARQIAINLQSPAPAVMTADRGEIEIILNNLVSNAVKYNRDGGKVDVSVSTADGFVTITVADTGIGMGAEEMAGLFGDFYRVKNQQTRNILGSGLGLSIVRKLADLYGGEAAVASTPGTGSTFTVTLSTHAPPKTADESPTHTQLAS